MQKITPFLWFDGQAEQAAKFYTGIFKSSRIESVSRYPEGSPYPAGRVMTVEFRLAGQRFIALNGGPEFKFTPAVSFFVDCKTRAEIDGLWRKLSRGGTALMGLDKYPFSERFGWVQDKFGVSWQVNLAGRAQTITPFLMFVGKQHGRAEEALKFYISLFKGSRIGKIVRYAAGEEEPAGTVKRATFFLDGSQFMAMDSDRPHPFTFNEALSFVVNCATQKEIDYFWKKLSAGGKEVQCGWLKDKFGLSWQIVPEGVVELFDSKDPARAERVMKAMLGMVKLDIVKLKQAYRGETKSTKTKTK